jgi:hypothetical protein
LIGAELLIEEFGIKIFIGQIFLPSDDALEIVNIPIPSRDTDDILLFWPVRRMVNTLCINSTHHLSCTLKI